MNKLIAAGVLSAAFALTACGVGKPKSDVATVDLTRIMANWPKFANYNNQIQADAFAIESSKAPETQKAKQRAELAQRYTQFQSEITNDVSQAAQQVATQKNLKMVFTRQGVGYGGTDITTDVEKILKIEEKATPKP
ncbi:MAG: OmpH family outer membrane protein [Candidatus Eremiobacteraeota bacterium]|nr:OmpH family outer membrane protein [Candidatus Eremiobacteraeota bacterium]